MAINGEFDREREVVFQIEEHLGVLAEYATGWRKEFNLVRWNGSAAKYDIRDWSPNHEHMSRGVTLHEKEMRLVVELLRKRRFQRGERQAAASQQAEEPVQDAQEQEL